MNQRGWVWYRKECLSRFDREFPSVKLLGYAEGHVILRYNGRMTFTLPLAEFLEQFQQEPIDHEYAEVGEEKKP